ncbi:MAG: putative lipid II flippase FtsW [Gammaproteobacteria bacterium]|nr:putative lipid II flippase FtsW [Gammaproteobacteria bacterium]
MSARQVTIPGQARPDILLVGVTALLLAIGLLMVTSASIALGDRQHGDAFYFLERQLVAAVIGLAAAWCMVKIPTRIWQGLGSWLAAIAITLLVLVVIPGFGNTVNGSTRWLSVGGINLVQVSEPARLMLLIYVADYAVRRNQELRSGLMGFVKPLLIVGGAAGLQLLQPDFGSAVLLLGISFTILFIAGARVRDVLVILVPVILAFVALARFSPYRMRRLMGFWNPWADPYGDGFQLTQSLIAIGSGEWTGLGLGGSVQKLFYLPEAHTDFIFAVIAEEFGLLGSLVMITLYGLLIWRALAVARAAAARDAAFPAYVASGLGMWLAIQALINLGVNMGVLPTKGLTLPLVSFGRSSLIVTLAALGLLLRIDLENRGLAGTGRRRVNGRARL